MNRLAQQTPATNTPVSPVPAKKLEYTLLAPLPDVRTENKIGGTNELSGYIPNIFNLIIALSAVIAVAYIIWGGFLYITTDAIRGKEDGKNHIKNAIYGLFMVSVSWLILFTINPRLLTFDLNIGDTSVPDRFQDPGIITTGAGCVDCVNIVGLQIKPGAGTKLKTTTLTKLQALNAGLPQGTTLYINEAYPPSRTHQNICHVNGSCIDARTVPDANVKLFIDASNGAGLKSVFEVETQQRKLAILTASCGLDNTCRNQLSGSIAVLPPRADGTRQITGEHFSVYDCQTDPVSCR